MYLVKQDIEELRLVSYLLAKEVTQFKRIAISQINIVIQLQHDDLVCWDTFIKKIVSKENVQQERLAASPYTRDNFYLPILATVDEPLKVSFSFYNHILSDIFASCRIFTLQNY